MGEFMQMLWVERTVDFAEAIEESTGVSCAFYPPLLDFVPPLYVILYKSSL